MVPLRLVLMVLIIFFDSNRISSVLSRDPDGLEYFKSSTDFFGISSEPSVVLQADEGGTLPVADKCDLLWAIIGSVTGVSTADDEPARSDNGEDVEFIGDLNPDDFVHDCIYVSILGTFIITNNIYIYFHDIFSVY